MTFVTGPVVVRAPATSANLGPGFDTLGMALTLYAEVGVGEPPGWLEGAHRPDDHHPAVRDLVERSVDRWLRLLAERAVAGGPHYADDLVGDRATVEGHRGHPLAGRQPLHSRADVLILLRQPGRPQVRRLQNMIITADDQRKI